MNILGFNPGHHSSVCLLQDGELKYFIQEERLTRKKYDFAPFLSFIDILQNYKIDFITWASPSILYPVDNNNLKSHLTYWIKLAHKYQSPKLTPCDYSDHHHHLCHATHAFYNSGFKECIGLVIDGLGSKYLNKDKVIGQETESIFYCSYPFNFKLVYKNVHIYNKIHKSLSKYKTDFNENINLSRAYEAITMYLGWNRNEAGKTMGLAPYGKHNENFPKFFNNKNGNPNVFGMDIHKRKDLYIKEDLNPQLKLSSDPKEWHHDESKITDLEKDLAWMIQNDTQQIVGDYVEKAIKETGLKQVCCAGGYFLNCVANYYLKKRFPDVEFYFEPIANDAGTAIGAAKLLWHNETQDTTIRPFKSLYLGKQYFKNELLEGIKKYT
jgi:carbamoyltransferase